MAGPFDPEEIPYRIDAVETRLRTLFPELPAKFQFEWRDIDFAGTLEHAAEGIAVCLVATLTVPAAPGGDGDQAMHACPIDDGVTAKHGRLTIDETGRLTLIQHCVCSDSQSSAAVLEYIILAALRAQAIMHPVCDAITANKPN